MKETSKIVFEKNRIKFTPIEAQCRVCPSSTIIKVSRENYKSLMEFSVKTGMSITKLADAFIEFATDHAELENE